MAVPGIDTSQLRSFEADLRRAPGYMQRAVPGIVSHGAKNIKNQLVEEMGRSTHFGVIARKGGISYDLLDSGTAAEIGPTKGKPGSLASIAYFGTSKGGGTVPDPRLALEAEIPNLELWLGLAAREAL